MYFRGIAADSKFQEKMKGYLFSEGYLFTGFYGNSNSPGNGRVPSLNIIIIQVRVWAGWTRSATQSVTKHKTWDENGGQISQLAIVASAWGFHVSLSVVPVCKYM